MAHPVQSFRKCVCSRKIKMWKLFQMGPIICKMMWGFQNWAQNSNRITFDPLFSKKKLPNLGIFFKNHYKIARFDSFFGQKGVKCYSIWILRPDLESSHHFTYHMPPLDIIFTFLIFRPPMHFRKFWTGWAIYFFISFLWCAHRAQRPNIQYIGWGEHAFSTKV